MSEQVLREVGLVVIGRNEGNRLAACLQSVVGSVQHIVYVDSGSTDGSCEMAADMGVHVIRLDMSVPFTAARARNVGWRSLMSRMPNLAFIQFADGDCELTPSWLNEGCTFLESNPSFAAVCGRLIEKYPDRSIYNRLCQYEWDAPSGETKACGGIAMFRATALVTVDGFRDDLIAGEEPELCYRLRLTSWKIMRLANSMAYHDAAIMTFSQWWRRSRRAGYAFAEGAWRHGRGPERYWVKETLRAAIYGLGIPFGILFFLGFGQFVALMGVLIYPFLWVRIFFRNFFVQKAAIFAFFQVLGKFPESFGAVQFWLSILHGSRQKIIEYK